MTLDLPEFHCTEDAEKFGASMSRDQYIFLAGARAALQAQISRPHYSETCDDLVVLVTNLQLIREALEAAPHAVLCSLSEVLPEARERAHKLLSIGISRIEPLDDEDHRPVAFAPISNHHFMSATGV